MSAGERKDKAPRLGRGLASLLGELGETGRPAGGTAQSLPVVALVPSGFQPRLDMAEDALEELATSIRAHGVLQPILVRPEPGQEGRFQIIAGERRWRAAQRAGLHEVPVHVRTLDDGEAMAAALIENLQRQDLNAIEEAEGLRRLGREFGLTQEMLSTSIGKSRSHVTNTLRLLGLPASVQHDVRRGTLSAGHARALLMHPDPAKAAMIVASRGLNVRQTESLARVPASPRNETRIPARPSDATLEIEALERDLTAKLGLIAKITFDGKGGNLSLRYRSIEQLEGVLRLLDPDR